MISKKRKIYLSEGGLGVIHNGLLGESEWNFHVSRGGDIHDLKPYGSDSKYSMAGRETGHFGSGTYFSTYKGDEWSREYGDLSHNMNPNFIQIKNNVYRVDFDLYKNLYRVRSEKQGDVLYTMCTELNHLYFRIRSSFDDFNPKNAHYDNSDCYQVIKRNAEALGLKCPSYYELVRMAQRHGGVQSFSTLFMEWNGFNGVNVSGIPSYDNTKHGSVIYDLSKVSDKIREVDVRIPFNVSHQYYNNTVAYDEFNDYEMSALKGEYLFWYEKINSFPLPRALRILKNFTKSGHVLSPFVMRDMSDELLSRYLRILYSCAMSSSSNVNSYGDYSDGAITLSTWFGNNGIGDEIMGKHSKYYVELIERVGAYYWANYATKSKSMLIELLWEFSYHLDWNLSAEDEKRVKEEYLNKVMSFMKRGLTKFEEEFIKEDYYE